MDGPRFDAATRAFAASRRGALRAIIAGPVAVLLADGNRREAAAACKKVGRRCDKNKDCCDGAECRGGDCRCKNDRDECAGKCFNLDTDERHCGVCNNACAAGETCLDGICVGPCGGLTCDATEECVNGVCTTPPGGCAPGADSCASNDDVPCGGQAACQCQQSTEGVTVCASGVPIPGVFCGSCDSSADCAEFGPGAFCARSTNTAVCCGPSAQNTCQLPCPA